MNAMNAKFGHLAVAADGEEIAPGAHIGTFDHPREITDGQLFTTGRMGNGSEVLRLASGVAEKTGLVVELDVNCRMVLAEKQ